MWKGTGRESNEIKTCIRKKREGDEGVGGNICEIELYHTDTDFSDKSTHPIDEI